jgi:phage-related protein
VPVNAVLTPMDVTCNGGNNGSFTLGTITCGALPFDYSVNGGAFGAIPTNLTAATYSVVIRDAGMQMSAPISVVIAQPLWTVNNPVGTNVAICQNTMSAMISASTTLANSSLTGTSLVTFDLAAQPIELSGGATYPTIDTAGNIIATANLPALPAGAVVTGVTFSFPNLTPTGNSYSNDVGFGFTGAVNTGYAAGMGAPNGTAAFSYTNTLMNNTVNITGGVINLNYYDLYSDNAGSECTFPTGNGIATLTINYSYPVVATTTWWDASTAGTQIGTGNSLETVGTTILPTTATPGVYNFYAQGSNLGCMAPARTLVTVTVKAIATGTQTLTICAGDTVMVGSVIHTTTGTYSDAITAGGSNGCDSLVTTNLTVLPAITGSQTLTVCAGGSVTVGSATHSTTGVFTDILMAANSCDSTVTTNLTVRPAVTHSQAFTVCSGGSVTVNGNVHSTTGTFTDVVTAGAANGCDSTVTTNLTVRLPITYTQTITVCAGGSVTVNGNVHSTTGTYTNVITAGAANGCDSTVTTNLTVRLPITHTQTLTVCAGGSVTVGGTTHSTNGTFTDILTAGAANGCDSTVTTNLTVLSAITGSQTLTVCSGGSVTVGGTTHSTNGTFTDILTAGAANGCDSTVTTNLTVLVAADASYTGLAATYCTTAGAVSLTATTMGGTFSGTGVVGNIFNPAVAGAGTFTIVYRLSACDSTMQTTTVSVCTAIAESGSQTINIYPNPTNGLFNIAIKNANYNELLVSIVDIQGKEVYVISDKNTTADYNKQIDLTGIAKGMYYIKLSTSTDVKIQKLIIQ